ncbi:MAG TPA: hypothetical protein PLX55_00440 [bacterium]|jgi:hypothetical protein|nr:hypothetical protein [bacterium]
MEDFIYLEIDEEITSIIDRLKEVKATKVGIVVPRGAMVLQSVVNLKLIKRIATQHKKQVAIITVDKVGRSLAVQVGLPVFDDLRQAEANAPEGSTSRQPVTSDVIEIDMSEPAEEEELPEGVKINYYTGEHTGDGEKEKSPEKAEKKPIFTSAPIASGEDKGGVKNNEKKGGRKRKVKIAIGITCVLLALVAGWLTLARATVTMVVAAEPLTAQTQVKIDATLIASQVEEGKIKGNYISVEKEASKNVKATGKKTVGEKSSGTVTFYNDAGADQILGAGTSLTGAGKSFVLSATITVPKATLDAYGEKVRGSTQGKIVASAAGTQFNLPSSTTYSISGNNYVSAKGETSGGTSEEKKIIAEDDISGAKDDLIADAPGTLRDELNKQATNLYLVEDAISYEIVDFKASKQAGEEADSFTVNAKLIAQTIVVDESELRQAVIRGAQKDIPEGKSLLESDKDELVSKLVNADMPKKEMELGVTLKSHIGNKIDEAGLAKKIKNKSVKQARQIVAESQGISADDVRVAVWPNTGLVRLPALYKNIEFDLEYKPLNSESPNEDSST